MFEFLCLTFILVSSISCVPASYFDAKDGPMCEVGGDGERFDCFPEDGANEADCVNRGCCWRSNSLGFGIDAPYCYFPLNFPNYQTIKSKTLNQMHASSYFIEKRQATFRPKEILNLTVDLFYDTDQRLRVQIYDPNNERYQVPVEVSHKGLRRTANTEYYVNIVDEPFGIKIYRKATQKLIFDTSIAPLIFADQFIQFSSYLPNDYIYGIGEHRDSFQHITDWSRFSIWNRDIPPLKHLNLYGAHPFYMCMEDDGNAMGFFLLNSNGMDVVLQPYPAITFLTIGGILDFFIYMGPTPNDVIHQHMMTVGLPFMPPYFALGFHLCRWGYENDAKLEEIIKRNRAAQIPYDTQWTDIDAMDSHRDWSYDTNKFANLPAIVEDLHNHGQHYINIIDPAISTTSGYEPYDDGLANNVFIKYLGTNEPLVGKVWPGSTVFPDFTNPNTSQWWTKMATNFHKNISFDGLWIDMNEPSNFVDGSEKGCTNDSYDEPPYIPKVLGGQLFKSTICPSSQQYISNHYNLHNMYGHFEAIASNAALQAINLNKRPFVLTRSSFAGTGTVAAHWSGDNRATWEDLYYSIPSILNFNMYGIPMIGADICGFALDTTEDLCTRWMQLGSFYPFMRNHNDNLSKDQDPAAFNPEIQAIMKNALNTRYMLLPYYYTLYYRSHVFGETVARPLFFEFPTELTTHSIDRQFLVGPAILVSPVLTPFTYDVDAYFPNATWYDLYNGLEINKTSTYVNLDAPFSKINAHIRGGYILPLQHPAVTTTQSRKNPFALLVALNTNASEPSYGSLFWDDGETQNTIETNSYNLVQFFAKDGLVQMQLDSSHAFYNTPMIFDTITVYGVKNQPTSVLINKQKYDNFEYDDNYKTLVVQYFNVDVFKLRIVNIEWF